MNINAKDVAELRKKTGCGMMDCKNALVAAMGDFDEAIKLLRERGLAVAAKKADRIAAEGIVDILVAEDGKAAAMVEVNSETDFVAKNEDFRGFVQDILRTILVNRPADVDGLLKSRYIGSDETVEAVLKNKIFTIGENLNIRRFIVAEGTLSTYVHGKGVTGIIVKFDADEKAASNPEFPEFAKNIALQAAALPSIYLDMDSVPESVLNEEKEILVTQIKQDPKNVSKPQNIIDKMVIGRLSKFYETNCLVEQPYIKDDDLSVRKYVENNAKAFGGSIKVTAFCRYEKGEGLQRREDNFADEVAKMVSK